MPRYNRPSGPERQARLKPQFADLYPGVVAGEWVPAWLLAEQLMRSAERRDEGGPGRVTTDNRGTRAPPASALSGGHRQRAPLRPRGGVVRGDPADPVQRDQA